MKSFCWSKGLVIFFATFLIGVILSLFIIPLGKVENTRFSSQQSKAYNPEDFNWGNETQNKCEKVSEPFREHLSLLREKLEIETTINEISGKKSKQIALLKKKLKVIEEKLSKSENERNNFKESNPNHTLLFVENCTEY